jgi:acyl-CoA thioesterase II
VTKRSEGLADGRTSDDGGSAPALDGIQRPPLGRILDLRQLSEFEFEGESYVSAPRIYGGQALGQALSAAGRTVPPGRRPHSLHGNFIHPGNTDCPVRYHVSPVRDGGSFSTRQVDALQDGRTIFHMIASFHRDEVGLAHQTPTTSAPSPEEILPFEQTLTPEELDSAWSWLRPLMKNIAVEFRFPEEYPRLSCARQQASAPVQRAWIRSPERLPPSPLVHAAAFAYCSDLFLLSSALSPHALTIDQPGVRVASLDHSVWLHQAFLADEWHLYEQRGEWAGNGRALCHGRLFDRNGVLVATTAQEGLVRRSDIV